MKKRLIVPGLFVCASFTNFCLYAATEHLIWGKADKVMPGLLPAGSIPKGILQPAGDRNYKLQPVANATSSGDHVRYQLLWKNIPVFGYQLIVHRNANHETVITGARISNIEQDVPSIQPKLSENAAERKVADRVGKNLRFKNITQVIFIDDEKTAHLAWHLSYYVSGTDKPVSMPNYIIDANSGSILREWNNARTERIGQGMGGNAFPLPWRTGMFQYGNALPGLPSLGKFDVEVKNGRCIVQNEHVRVINLENNILGYSAFPITIVDELNYELEPFSYKCDEASLYMNYADGASGPVNYSFSPVNDTMYFASQTVDMYQKVYKVAEPLGDDLPLRAYTHLGEMDNAFAIPTVRINGVLLAHQQIVIGNGEFYLTAPAQSVIAHELSHNFTEINSGLVYEGQSGGINESFSDMAAIALQEYIRQDYPWYWDGADWALGREAMIGGEPLRYMDEPSKDGASISNAKDYYFGMDPHYSSGVFNKAFYLLAHKPGFSVQKAFQLMIDANMHYWSPIAYYDFAACGVMQAALDRNEDVAAVTEAFAEVGVICPVTI